MACNEGAEDEPWLTIFWDVENYSDYAKGRYRCISSPTFRVESVEKSTWVFGLYPQGRNDEDYISYLLNGSLSEETSEVIEVDFEVAILAEDGSVLKVRDSQGTSYRSGSPRCVERFVLRELTNTKREIFLSRDTLRTRCRLWRTSGKINAPMTFFGLTALKEEKRIFTGCIKRFSSLDWNSRPMYHSFHNTVFTKPYFSMNLNDRMEIQIKISLKDMDATYLAIHSFIRCRNGCDIDCKKLEIWPDEGEEEMVYILPFTKQHVLDHRNLFLVSDVLWIFSKLSLQSLKQCVSYTPVVSLACGNNKNKEIKVFDVKKIDLKITSPSNLIIPNSYVSNAEVSQLTSTSDLKEDFEHLYSKGILSDVTLRTESETFHAHKTILSARSPVFLAMFTTDMKESIQDYVDVSDLENDTVRRMLLYVYTNNLEDLHWESAFKLYPAADKYQIVTLKKKCAYFLKQNLCPSNVCDVLSLADMHGDEGLKNAAQDHVLAHEKDVFSSQKWKEFAKTYSALALDTMLRKWKGRTE
ncbi:TD and POZ domain-containing protein 3 [Trichonephila clavipes]|nr:TD and POZ domain-containing protein 3 [Trichonephila clavipes]